ncbi:hypothetical protein ACHQM5_027689 [Ranunculus cassubicifolius]
MAKTFAASWSEVPKNLLEDIFERLFLGDHLGFSSVCSSWRSACVENRYLPSRCVGLIVPGEIPDSETRRLLEPVQGEYNNNNNPINVPVPHRYHCCGTSFGWLVLIDDDLDMQLLNPITGAKIELSSGTTLVSPSTKWGFEKFGKHFVRKAVLSCDPACSTSETTVFVICGGYCLAFSRPADKSWRVIAKGEHGSGPGLREYCDAIFHKDKFYVVYNSPPPPGGVLTCDLSDTDNPIVADYAPSPRCEIFNMTRYLVESNGELFQLRRHFTYDLERPYNDIDSDCDDFHCDGGCGEVTQNDEAHDGDDRDEVNQNDEVHKGTDSNNDRGEVNQNDEVVEGGENDDDRDGVESDESEGESDFNELARRYRTSRFKVYKLIDCGGYHARKWKKVKIIGDKAFFVGKNSSFSLSTSDYLGCKPNSIYFTDCKTLHKASLEPIRHDVSIFNMEDKSIQNIYPLDSKPMRPSAFWFTPIPW